MSGKTAPAVASGGESHDISGTTSADHPSVLNQGAENNPAEQASVSAQMPNFFAFLYTQFMFLNAFSWTSDQRPGTVIWKTPLHPLFMNEIIVHFAEIFNLWAGSFDFKLLIAGTGFLGGKLAVVWIPPNKDLDKMTLQDKTVFSFAIVDPKENEPIHFTARDMRIQKAHWMNYDTKIDYSNPNQNQLENYAKLGGYLAIVVVNQLVNSSQTNAAANISVFNKLGPDFAFNQFVPPTRLVPQSLPLPDINFTDDEVHPFFANLPLRSLNVNTVVTSASFDTSTLVNPRTGKFSRRDKALRHDNCGNFRRHFNGTSAGISSDAFTFDTKFHKYPLEVAGGENTFFANFKMQQPTLDLFKYFANDPSTTTSSKFNMISFYSVYNSDLSQEKGRWYSTSGSGYIGSLPNAPILYDNLDRDDTTYTIKFVAIGQGNPDKDFWITSDINESIVAFGSTSDDDGAGIPLTRSLSDYFKTSPIKVDNQDPIFDIIDIRSQLPIATLRLNPDGFFSTSKATTIKRFDLKKILLRHTGFLDHHAQLPKPTAFDTNAAAFELRELIEKNQVTENERELRYVRMLERMERKASIPSDEPQLN